MNGVSIFFSLLHLQVEIICPKWRDKYPDPITIRPKNTVPNRRASHWAYGTASFVQRVYRLIMRHKLSNKQMSAWIDEETF